MCRELTCEGTESNYMHGALILSPLDIMCAKACDGHPNCHFLRDGVGVYFFFLFACVLFLLFRMGSICYLQLLMEIFHYPCCSCLPVMQMSKWSYCNCYRNGCLNS